MALSVIDLTEGDDPGRRVKEEALHPWLTFSDLASPSSTPRMAC